MLLYTLLYLQPLAAQCNGTVSNYPYNEDFENSNAGWKTGGNSSDWALGTPQKSKIKNAASGVNCWITGGLNKAAYNNNEYAYLQSPCLDLTTLLHPYIRFKYFCDTEQDWDGANLQYSLDNGVTWVKAGYFGQPEDCINSSWYNDQRVHFLNNDNGWSGADITGGKWTTAQMKLPFTGGAAKTVMLRFYFGAGDKNNNYNGFGIDDFFMGEAPDVTNLSFTYNCLNNLSVDFTADASACFTNLQWNFNDAASGVANKANGSTAKHQFSAPGNYLVSLTAIDKNGGVVTKTNSVNLISASANILSAISCTGGTAQLQAVVQGDNSMSYQYKWNSSPEITIATATLPAGNFLLEVSGENTCSAQVQVNIKEPTPLITEIAIVQPDCSKSNGSIHVNVSGGTFPYTYNWQPLVSNTPDAANLQQADYIITIKDSNGCTVSTNAYLQPQLAQVHLGNDTTICYGQTLVLKAGDFNSYLWDDLSNRQQRIIDKAGVYFVKVTTANGCTASDTIKIMNDCGDVYFPSAFTPNKDLLNDVFGPTGNIGLLKNYSLRIYNRFGNLIFNSTNPAQKWNGSYNNGIAVAGTYTYIAIYEYNGVKKISKGTLLLLL